jgi:hypothetical protein
MEEKEICINLLFDYLGKLDSERDIEIAADRLVKDNGWSRLQALSTLHSKYQSERHLEEVVIINRLIGREKSKTKAEPETEPETGFHEDM